MKFKILRLNICWSFSGINLKENVFILLIWYLSHKKTGSMRRKIFLVRNCVHFTSNLLVQTREKLIFVTVKNYLYWSKVKYSTSTAYSPVPNNSPPRLQSFGFYVRPSLSYLDPTNPSLINFPNFVLQIFQRLLKPIVLLAKLLAV